VPVHLAVIQEAVAVVVMVGMALHGSIQTLTLVVVGEVLTTIS
jgi:hypothetical protein